jgi:S-(hydroxymethyl)glutathione dehydrogenase / alcohol dehydrogenase
MKSKSAILFKPGSKLEILEVDVDPPRNGEVLVKMAASGICHSDLHVMTGHLEGSLPAVLGHEGAGIVVEVGPGVTSLKPGDHVIPLWRLSCGTCEYCSNGRPALCALGHQIRMTGRLLDGTTRFKFNGKEINHWAGVSSFSEYTVIPEPAIVKIPEEFSLDNAALLGCAVITGLGAVFNAAKVRPGSDVAVFGMGGVGVNVVQGASIAGANKIIGVDVLTNKLKQAKQFGVTHTVNSKEENPVEAIRELTNGRGVDYAFEVVGLPEIIRQAYDSLCKRGMAVAVGVAPFKTEVSIPIMTLVYEERVLTGSVYGSGRPKIDIPMMINLYRAGKLKLDELLTRKYKFNQINEAFEALKRGEVIRSIITF